MNISDIAQWPATAIVAFAFLLLLYDLTKQRREQTKERRILAHEIANHLTSLLERADAQIAVLKEVKISLATLWRDHATHRGATEGYLVHKGDKGGT